MDDATIKRRTGAREQARASAWAAAWDAAREKQAAWIRASYPNPFIQEN
jgi:hypothetical protein